MTPRSLPCVVRVDDASVVVPTGASALAALVAAGTLCTRRSVTGAPRFALCGIGHCQECRITVDGRPQQLACRTVCRDGLHIQTGAAA